MENQDQPKSKLEMKWISKNDTDLYEKSLVLREQILRVPLGMKLERESLKEDNVPILTVWDQDECVGTMALYHEDAETSRMRYVAVQANRQGQGIGRMMTQEFEAESIRKGYSRIYMHARVVALDFYIKQGYEVFGDGFLESTLPHRHA